MGVGKPSNMREILLLLTLCATSILSFREYIFLSNFPVGTDALGIAEWLFIVCEEIRDQDIKGVLHYGVWNDKHFYGVYGYPSFLLILPIPLLHLDIPLVVIVNYMLFFIHLMSSLLMYTYMCYKVQDVPTTFVSSLLYSFNARALFIIREGHLFTVLGYSLTPFLLFSIENLLTKRTLRVTLFLYNLSPLSC